MNYSLCATLSCITIDLTTGRMFPEMLIEPTFVIMTGDGEFYDGEDYPVANAAAIPEAIRMMTELLPTLEWTRATLWAKFPNYKVAVYEWDKFSNGNILHGTTEQRELYAVNSNLFPPA